MATICVKVVEMDTGFSLLQLCGGSMWGLIRSIDSCPSGSINQDTSLTSVAHGRC